MVIVSNAKNNFFRVKKKKQKNENNFWKISKQEILGSANLHWRDDNGFKFLEITIGFKAVLSWHD